MPCDDRTDDDRERERRQGEMVQHIEYAREARRREVVLHAGDREEPPRERRTHHEEQREHELGDAEHDERQSAHETGAARVPAPSLPRADRHAAQSTQQQRGAHQQERRRHGFDEHLHDRLAAREGPAELATHEVPEEAHVLLDDRAIDAVHAPHPVARLGGNVLILE